MSQQFLKNANSVFGAEDFYYLICIWSVLLVINSLLRQCVDLRVRVKGTWSTLKSEGFVYLFQSSSSHPHYDWSGLGYIQAVWVSPDINGSHEGPVSYLVTTTPSTPRMVSFWHREAQHPNHYVVDRLLFFSAPDQPNHSSPGSPKKYHLFTHKMFGRGQIWSKACN